MSYIEIPVAEYRRRLAAVPGARQGDRASASTTRPVPAVTEDDARVARTRYPEAFDALDMEALPGEEVAKRERLIVAAVNAVHGSSK